MNYRIGIIGAGWYGCHIASALKSLGFSVAVFDKGSRVLDEASGNNQFRLHMGFHYPRHHSTRIQSLDGFIRFLERYPQLTREVPENIYAVPSEDSLLDFHTYRLIMTASGIDFLEREHASIELRGISGLMMTNERVLLIAEARKYFTNLLSHSLQLDTMVTSVLQASNGVVMNGERFDFVIDATWGHMFGVPMPVYYEPTILLYYEGDPNFPAVTLVDGPLCSIYPTQTPGLYTLSSVSHTPLARTSTATEARAVRDSVDTATVTAKVAAMEAQISQYVPSFRDVFRFAGPQFSIKTKPVGRHDDRSCYVFRNGRIFSVMSGKIDTVFYSVERILSFIQSSETESLMAGKRGVSRMSGDALIGHTGLVGSNLLASQHFDTLYNSANIGDIAGRSYRNIVCAGVTAVKWWANQNPDQDRRRIESLIAHLDQVETEMFTLISTVDVYPDCSQVNESTPIELNGLHPYGRNREMLEAFVARRFPRHLIVRLPAVFGRGRPK